LLAVGQLYQVGLVTPRVPLKGLRLLFLLSQPIRTQERPSSAAEAAPSALELRETAIAAAVSWSAGILIMASSQRVHWCYQQPGALFLGDHDEILQPAASILLGR